ncbi:MAG: pentapeptide repeat-containing protein [Cyanobacteria bacterium P01_F01_bin.150]
MRADLRSTNLNGADLRYANIRSANLSGANLSEANLSGVGLRYANLSYANLNVANLSYANLSLADFNFTDLNRVNLCSTVLSGARGLMPEQLICTHNLESANLDDGLRHAIAQQFDCYSASSKALTENHE